MTQSARVLLDGKEYEIILTPKIEPPIQYTFDDLKTAISTGDTEKALMMIDKMDESELGKTDKDGRTALILACNLAMSEVALRLIETGHSKPDHVDRDGRSTALIFACYKGMEEVALRLIETGHSKPDHVNHTGTTALMWACFRNLTQVALRLIETGHSKPDHVNLYGDTALNWACDRKMEEVALRLIETGHSKPDHVNCNGNTALTLACSNNLTQVALSLIKVLSPDTIDNRALWNMCHNRMEVVAIAFVSKFKYNDEWESEDKPMTIRKKAEMNEMTDLLAVL